MPISYLALAEHDDLSKIRQSGPFKCAILLAGHLSPDWRDALIEKLLDAGCVYAMVYGPECEKFHDRIDEIAAEKIWADERVIMTTWHGNETLSELFHFAKFAANHPDIDTEEVLIADIGVPSREMPITTAFRQA